MSKRNPTFVPLKHTIKEFEPYGISRVQAPGSSDGRKTRWVTIDTQSAYDNSNNLITRGVRIKIKAF